MLRSLYVENMAIISRLNVDFDGGLLAVTGETGAGKSVIVDCLLFLLGGKPDRDLLRRGATKGVVEAVFTDVGTTAERTLAEMGYAFEGELLLQRTLAEDGRTTARLNGRSIPQGMLRELGKTLVSIHGQNDNQLLLSEKKQAALLDSATDFGTALADYTKCYKERQELVRALSALTVDAAEQQRLADMLDFQMNEINAASLKAGEEEKLLSLRDKLANAEKISKSSALAYHLLYGSEKSVAVLLEHAAGALSRLSGVLPDAAPLAARLEEMRYEAVDIAESARDFTDGLDGDPTKALDKIEARLDLIAKLCRKYGKDTAEVLAFAKAAMEKRNALENGDAERERLTAEIGALERKMKAYATALHEVRVMSANALSEKINAELAFLDMAGATFAISIEPTADFTPTGTDETVFMISTNKGEGMKPLSRVASGGELARVMLAVRSVLSDREGAGTALFDEVDTGISGKTARKIGIKLAEIARHTQVLSVTHSAQIASLATAHYKIEKEEAEERTVSRVTLLDDAARVEEIARILGGLSVTDTQRKAAEEMIREGRAYR